MLIPAFLVNFVLFSDQDYIPKICTFWTFKIYLSKRYNFFFRYWENNFNLTFTLPIQNWASVSMYLVKTSSLLATCSFWLGVGEAYLLELYPNAPKVGWPPLLPSGQDYSRISHLEAWR